MARLREIYRTEITDEMIKKFGYKNRLQVPRIKKISINVGLGKAMEDSKLLDNAIEGLAVIAGQRPAVTKARKSIANFKVRKNVAVGCKLTLRGKIMYEFLDRFICVAIPRIKDFRGLSPKSFDKSNNYSMGLTEQTIFPEIEYDRITLVHGMDITMVTNAHTKEEAFELLRLMGMPFKVR